MIEVLNEAKVTGKAIFIPSPGNLKQLSDAALEATTENADELDKMKASINILMLSIAELQEAHDALEPAEEPKENTTTDAKGEETNVKNKN